jgi:hypothetical protein
MVLGQKQIYQWNRTEDPEINPYGYNYLFLIKYQKHTMGKKTNSSKNGVGKTGYPHGED